MIAKKLVSMLIAAMMSTIAFGKHELDPLVFSSRDSFDFLYKLYSYNHEFFVSPNWIWKFYDSTNSSQGASAKYPRTIFRSPDKGQYIAISGRPQFVNRIEVIQPTEDTNGFEFLAYEKDSSGEWQKLVESKDFKGKGDCVACHTSFQPLAPWHPQSGFLSSKDIAIINPQATLNDSASYPYSIQDRFDERNDGKFLVDQIWQVTAKMMTRSIEEKKDNTLFNAQMKKNLLGVSIPKGTQIYKSLTATYESISRYLRDFLAKPDLLDKVMNFSANKYTEEGLPLPRSTIDSITDMRDLLACERNTTNLARMLTWFYGNREIVFREGIERGSIHPKTLERARNAKDPFPLLMYLFLQNVGTAIPPYFTDSREVFIFHSLIYFHTMKTTIRRTAVGR